MKKMGLKLLAWGLPCLLLNPAQAAVMLSGGLSHEYSVNPGSTISGVLELKNTGNEAAEVKIYQEDVKINADGSTEYTVGNGGHNRSNAQWIRIGVDRVILAPGESQSIPYTLQVPSGNLSGSYWSMLMLEPVSKKSRESQLAAPATDKPTLTIHQKMRYAVQVLTNVGNQAKANLTFDAPKVEKNDNGARVLNFAIRNTGTRHSRPKVWLDVFNGSGESVGRFEAETHGLYNGERENFSISLDKLSPGSYKALLAAEDNNSGQVFGSDVNLTIKP